MTYQESQRLIFEAEEALRNGDLKRAQQRFLEAATIQKKMVAELPNDKPKTKSTFGVSAAWLLVKAGALNDADEYALELLREPWLNRRSYNKLTELFNVTSSRREELCPHDLSPIIIDRFRFDEREFIADPALVYAPWHEDGMYGAEGPPGLHVTAPTREGLIEEIQEAIAYNWIDFVEADESTLTNGQRLLRCSTMAVVQCAPAAQEAEQGHG